MIRCLMVLAMGAALLALAALLGWSLPWLALLHLVVMLLAWAGARQADEGERLDSLQLILLAFCFPIIGAAAAVLMNLRREDELHQVVEDYRAYVNREGAERLEARAFMAPRQDARREASVRPFADQLREGDLTAKQQAAEALAREGDAEAVETLRGATFHADPDARLFASIALGRIEARHAEALKQARQQNRDAYGCVAAARSARAYLASGLPVGKAKVALWEEVEALCRQALHGPAEPPLFAEAWAHIAAARLAMGDPAGALEATAEALKKAPTSLEALRLRCEALMLRGEVRALREAARELGAVAPAGSPEAEASAFWAPAS